MKNIFYKGSTIFKTGRIVLMLLLVGMEIVSAEQLPYASHGTEKQYALQMPLGLGSNGTHIEPNNNSETGTKFIRDDATGGDCTAIGTWDNATKTCTLTGDVNETIQIDSDNITLDGSGHTVSGDGTDSGVYLPGRSYVTIKNMNVKGFEYGIFTESSSNNGLLSNNVTENRYGIVLYMSDNNSLTNNNVSNNLGFGIFLESSSSNVIKNNIANNNQVGIGISRSSNNTLTSNTMSDNGQNFGLEGQSDTDFENDIDTSNTVGGKPIYYVKNAVDQVYDGSTNAGTFYCINCDNITLKGLTLTDNRAGVYLWKTQNSKIENINATKNYNGLNLFYSNNNDLTGINASNNGWNGINLLYSSNNNLNGNRVLDNFIIGIYLFYSGDNSLTDNTMNSISYPSSGIFVHTSSDNNTLSGNNASNNGYGITIQSASNNTLTDNIMSGNRYNFGVSGGSDSNFDHNIDMSNTVNGKPVYYIKNAVDQIYDESTNAGIFYCINCDNVTVKDLKLTKNIDGVSFWKTQNSRIENIQSANNENGISLGLSSNNNITGSNASNNKYGITTISSENNNIKNNTASNNEAFGILIDDNSNNNSLSGNTALNNQYGITLDFYSNNNSLSDNTALNNKYGLHLRLCSDDTLTSNNALNNEAGILLIESDNNTIYNNLFNNTNNSILYNTGGNYWNTTRTQGKNIVGGPYLGGNFWASPDGSGYSQTCKDSNSDGICDDPYTLNESNIDHLPLAVPKAAGGIIHGTKFNDLNGNEMQDTGESGLANWTIKLAGFDKFTMKAVNKQTVTDASGNYRFTDLTPGFYTIFETPEPGWMPTTSPVRSVHLDQNQVIVMDFGNRRI